MTENVQTRLGVWCKWFEHLLSNSRPNPSITRKKKEVVFSPGRHEKQAQGPSAQRAGVVGRPSGSLHVLALYLCLKTGQYAWASTEALLLTGPRFMKGRVPYTGYKAPTACLPVRCLLPCTLGGPIVGEFCPLTQLPVLVLAVFPEKENQTCER
jgi:hypothetical protein